MEGSSVVVVPELQGVPRTMTVMVMMWMVVVLGKPPLVSNHGLNVLKKYSCR